MNAPLPDKLGNLIRRLGSDKAGEVVAVVAAIRRQLASRGLDLHDLAARLTVEAEPCRCMREPEQADMDAAGWTYDDAVEWLLDRADELTPKEIRFVRSMRRILRRWEPSEKQERWLRVLVERLGGPSDG